MSRKLLDAPIADLRLTPRAVTAVRKAGATTVREILEKGAFAILEVKGCVRTTLNQIKRALEAHGTPLPAGFPRRLAR